MRWISNICRRCDRNNALNNGSKKVERGYHFESLFNIETAAAVVILTVLLLLSPALPHKSPDSSHQYHWLLIQLGAAVGILLDYVSWRESAMVTNQFWWDLHLLLLLIVCILLLLICLHLNLVLIECLLNGYLVSYVHLILRVGRLRLGIIH